jgi:hypothetical protein
LNNKTIQKQPCAICGKEKVEAHHENYGHPLRITWLCVLHHRRRHNDEKFHA